MRNTILLGLLSFSLSACDLAATGGVGGGGAGGGYNHRVRPRETLFSIAERAYGNGLEWQRIYEANPHVDPDHLKVGEVVWVPEMHWRGPAVSQVRQDYMLDPGTGNFGDDSSSNRWGNPPGGQNIFRNILPGVAEKTFFGASLPKVGSVILLWFILHAMVQGFMVWITTNVTFVQDASIKKAMKATFMTESLTLCTLVLLGIVGLMMVYVGTAEPSGAAGTQLFPTVEEYLRHPMGMAIAAFGLLFLYIVLSMRFVPQVFGLETGRGLTVVFLAILLPHLLAFYVLGQRLGLIQ